MNRGENTNLCTAGRCVDVLSSSHLFFLFFFEYFISEPILAPILLDNLSKNCLKSGLYIKLGMKLNTTFTRPNLGCIRETCCFDYQDIINKGKACVC